MKVSFLPESVIRYLPLFNKVFPFNSQVPILSNALLEAKKEGFYITATDLDLGVRIKIPAKIEKEGGVTVPGKEFLETLSNLPKEKVVIEVEKEKANIKCSDSNIFLNTIAKEEYPQIYKEMGEKVTTIGFDEFTDTFFGIMFSLSQEETRPQLTGVYVDAGERDVSFVTTDGYRMSVKSRPGKGMVGAKGLIIPSKLINEALSLKGEGSVTLYVNEKERQIILEIGESLLVGRMIDGKFPNYEGVLPKKTATEVIFDREGLLQQTRLISILAKDNSNIANLSVKGGTITLETKSQGLGEGETSLECTQKGEDVKISFNIRYLGDVLKADKGKEMKIGLNSSSEPAVFKNPKGDFIHVIMPIQVE